MSKSRKYPEELLERGVRLVFESGRPIAHVAADLGVGAETLRKRVRQAEADSGKRSDLLTSAERASRRQERERGHVTGTHRSKVTVIERCELGFAQPVDDR